MAQLHLNSYTGKAELVPTLSSLLCNDKYLMSRTGPSIMTRITETLLVYWWKLWIRISLWIRRTNVLRDSHAYVTNGTNKKERAQKHWRNVISSTTTYVYLSFYYISSKCDLCFLNTFLVIKTCLVYTLCFRVSVSTSLRDLRCCIFKFLFCSLKPDGYL